MAAKNAYLDWISEWLAPLGEIAVRAMMGGHIVYCDCVTFALVHDGALYLKADEKTRPKFETLGLKPFRPFATRSMTMSYYAPPPEFFEDADVMLAWGREAVAAGIRSKAKKAKSPANRRASER